MFECSKLLPRRRAWKEAGAPAVAARHLTPSGSEDGKEGGGGQQQAHSGSRLGRHSGGVEQGPKDAARRAMWDFGGGASVSCWRAERSADISDGPGLFVEERPVGRSLEGLEGHSLSRLR